MTPTPRDLGLDTFSHDLNPAIVGMIRSWQGDPELDSIYRRLQSRKMRRGFLDSFAEALVALNARRHGCSIQVEVPTPLGKMCDLLVERDGVQLYVHIKRLGGRRTKHRRVKISSRLRILERIQRPWIVKIRWQDDLDDTAMQFYVIAAAAFIEQARLGDEHVVRDEQGNELGGIKIMAPNDENQVSLVIGLTSGFIDDSPRVIRLFQRAHKQFMPRATNVILICTPDVEGEDEVETALYGTHVERWDEHPAKGKRVAHGRSADGFWQSNHMVESQLAGWFWLAPMHHEYQGKIWIREGGSYSPDEVVLANDLFSTE